MKRRRGDVNSRVIFDGDLMAAARRNYDGHAGGSISGGGWRGARITFRFVR
jgi:hypothetical protein